MKKCAKYCVTIVVFFFLGKIQISVEADLNDKVAKNGVRYWTIQNWKHGFELKHKSTLELENLFNGNEVLGA